jgi:hypothetical protein
VSCSSFNRIDDLLIARTSAKIPGYGTHNFFSVGRRIPFEQGFGRHDRTRRAEPTLNRAVVKKCLLEWMEFRILSQTLYRNNLTAVQLRSEQQTSVDSLAVHNHRARSALAYAAAFFHTREPNLIAQHVKC